MASCREVVKQTQFTSCEQDITTGQVVLLGRACSLVYGYKHITTIQRNSVTCLINTRLVGRVRRSCVGHAVGVCSCQRLVNNQRIIASWGVVWLWLTAVVAYACCNLSAFTTSHVMFSFDLWTVSISGKWHFVGPPWAQNLEIVFPLCSTVMAFQAMLL